MSSDSASMPVNPMLWCPGTREAAAPLTIVPVTVSERI